MEYQIESARSHIMVLITDYDEQLKAEKIAQADCSESALRDLHAQILRGSVDSGVVDQLRAWLQVGGDWNWLEAALRNTLKELQLDIALAWFEKSEEDLYDVMVLISLYMNAKTPWSNSQLAERADTIDIDRCKTHMPRLVEHVTSQILQIENHKVSLAGYRRLGSNRSGLRPTLGFSAGSAAEEEKRTNWKHSANVTVLSSVCLLMRVGNRWDQFGTVWPKITTFILNVLDDSDPLFRAQGCFLLEYYLDQDLGLFLLKSGLAPLFRESVETCFSYLPKLTPAEVSLRLLRDGAYPALYKLLRLQDHSYLPFLEVLDKNILGPISHVQGRDHDRSTNELLSFLLSQILVLVRDYVGAAILACFSRTNFMLNQLLINPYIVESELGHAVVNSALEAQHASLTKILETADPEASRLIFQYKYDLLGAWTILAKRAIKFGVGSPQTNDLLVANVDVLRQIARSIDCSTELDGDIEAVTSTVPEVKDLIH